ncbi:MAG: phosphatidate cytidylyltransferase [Candidatus Nomurabacteria bacterium]|jgi:CDP-diglyceride synthetase|nr:phosphatidate cytidylyltransferase [Candidatus Nomurabacteria bacterium]
MIAKKAEETDVRFAKKLEKAAVKFAKGMKKIAAWFSRTAIPTVAILAMPLTCMWAYWRDPLLGQVLTQVFILSLCYLSVRELNAMMRFWADEPGWSIFYWRVMTVIWLMVMSFAIWAWPDRGVWLVTGLTILMFVADATAMTVGVIAVKAFKVKTLGQRWPILEQWSPSKTIVGTVVCLLVAWSCFTATLMWAFSIGWLPADSLPWFVALAVFFPIFGVLGDFLESHIKRTFFVKDSSNALDPHHIVPWGRHGGASDRIDSLVGGVAGFATIVILVVAAAIAALCALVYFWLK